jgi:hypothetical protein
MACFLCSEVLLYAQQLFDVALELRHLHKTRLTSAHPSQRSTPNPASTFRDGGPLNLRAQRDVFLHELLCRFCPSAQTFAQRGQMLLSSL